MTRYLLILGFLALSHLSNCKSPGPGSLLDSVGNRYPYFVSSLDSWEQFKAISQESTGILRNGRTVKFLVDLRTKAVPKVFFINANFSEGGGIPDYVKMHYYFAQRSLQIGEELLDFNNSTYFTTDKKYVAGTIQSYSVDGFAKPLVSIHLYPQDAARGALIAEIAKIVFAKVRLPDSIPAFVQTGKQQTLDNAGPNLKELGVEFLTLERIIGAQKYIMLNEGEAYGYLRLFPKNQDNLSPKDIAIFAELPLDLSVVSAVITKEFQDTNSHINLKSKERGTPNAVLRDVGPTHSLIKNYIDKPVHLVIRGNAMQVTSASTQDVDNWFNKRNSKPWQKVSFQSSRNLLSYDEMCPSDPAGCFNLAYVYGSKAANLGFLANPRIIGRVGNPSSVARRTLGLTLDPIPMGLGVPLQHYFDFVNYGPNAALKRALDEFIDLEKKGNLSSAQRADWVARIQSMFFKGVFPPENLAMVRNSVQRVLPGVEKIKIRSSANAEDIEGFDGAGLHDSYSARPAVPEPANNVCNREVEADDGGGEVKAKMNPRSIGCAIKGSYASLWNKRAIEERSFARMDHGTATMGVSILPSYDFESKIRANSVLVTRVINADDVLGYSLSIQRKNNLVTNPSPNTFSETSIAALADNMQDPASLTFTRFAKPTAESPQMTGPILDDQTMQMLIKMARLVETSYCYAKGDRFYSGDCQFISMDTRDKPKSLDMEFKLLENGQIVLKQVREFSGK